MPGKVDVLCLIMNKTYFLKYSVLFVNSILGNDKFAILSYIKERLLRNFDIEEVVGQVESVKSKLYDKMSSGSRSGC
jgi:hypothetical protein